MSAIRYLLLPCFLALFASLGGCDSPATTELAPVEDKSIYEAEEQRFEVERESGGGGV